MQLMTQLLNDEAGFIVSAELILVSTISVLALVVGFSEVSFGINQELEDVGAAVGSLNQSFHFSGICSQKGMTFGSCFRDRVDICDHQNDIQTTMSTSGEGGNNGNSR